MSKLLALVPIALTVQAGTPGQVTATTFGLASIGAALVPTAPLLAQAGRVFLSLAAILKPAANQVLDVALLVQHHNDSKREALVATLLSSAQGASPIFMDLLGTAVDITTQLRQNALLVLRLNARVSGGTGELRGPTAFFTDEP